MKFYQSIHQFYDNIFPYNEQQLRFVESQSKGKGKMLDVGCGTGSLAINMAKNGFDVTAIDLEVEMIEIAKNKSTTQNPVFKVANMLNIDQFFPCNHFDVITCFGNTLVHLTDNNDVVKFLLHVNRLLKPEGKFLLQILNYEYILQNNITQLPVIENDTIRFIREYVFLNTGYIEFRTSLFIKENAQTINNTVVLNPIKSIPLIELLEKRNFRKIDLFGNFSGSALTFDSLPLIISSIK